MNTIKMAVFDMAGTTVDENNIVYKTLHQTIHEHGYEVTLKEVLAHGAGKEKLEAIRDVMQAGNHHAGHASIQTIFESFLGKLAEAYQSFPLKPQPYAAELFEKLKASGIRVVLNTGYDRNTAEYITNQLGWKENMHFDALITASDVSKNRPEPDMILLAMKKLGIADAGQVMKIGDSAIDIHEGRNAGCALCIGITTGAQNREQLATAKPDHIIDHLSEIIGLI